MKSPRLLRLIFICVLARSACGEPTGELGLFTDQSDVGVVQHAGETHFNAAADTCVVSGSGANMWFTNDAFHFVWKKVSGDVSLSANIRFLDNKGLDHRKACLMVRQSLEPDSAYADAAQHANGLTSLQFRETTHANTAEIQVAPPRPPGSTWKREVIM
jgi:hypothetical protein